MVVQHNMSALNTNRMLGITNWHLAKSAEKLASGYKINRAADDAAGLSISEKMRKKIRGLDKGMENVQDGISLCQVADGALNEVADMLQRIRELSIKAYNDTNSKSDRHIIQDEIGQCIDELDRVFETTKFNEIYIFRNGQRMQGDVFHSEPYMTTQFMRVCRDMPEWMTINDQIVDAKQHPQIEVHSNYLGSNSQDTNGIMKQDFKLKDDTFVKLYYGADHGTTSDGYQWVGDFIQNDKNSAAYKELMQPGQALYESMKSYLDANGNYNGNYKGWTETLQDNVSAKLDFSGLIQAADASDLYNKLSELVGVELAFPCGTCDRMAAVRFGGSFRGIDNLIFYDQFDYVGKGEINLSEKSFNWNGKTYTGYFEAIESVMADNNSNANATQDLAKAIAADLAQSTYHTLSSAMTSHYDRAIKDPSEPYSVYIYDFRDVDMISPGSSVKSNIMTYSRIGFDYEVTVEGGYYTHYDGWSSDQIWIQASDEVGDGMPILSKYLSAEVMKLTGYTVDNYTSEIKMVDPEGYQRRLEAWEKAVPEPETKRYTEKVNVIKSITPAVYDHIYENGEFKDIMVKPPVIETEEEEREFLVYIYDESKVGPRPKPEYTTHEVYAPSELSLIDDALAMVSSVRSYYGAVQNRLEHTYKNNANAHENITYAESRIRDTDMAEELVKNSMLNILKQAGFSMLSQANQINQGVSMLLS